MTGIRRLGFIDLDNKTTVDQVTMIRNYKGGNMHLFTVSHAISKETAMRLQTELSYHPAGYGFYGFDSTISQTTWKCSNSCD